MKNRIALGILILSALFITNVGNLAADETWTRKANMPTQRSGFATCVVNGKIYAIGGNIQGFGNLSISTVEMYDPETDTWQRKADIPTPRTNPSASVVDGKVYVIGGTDLKQFEIHAIVRGEFKKFERWEAKELSTVEMYDPATDTWSQKADMPTPRDTDTCVVDGKIYAIGGTSFINITKNKPWRVNTVEVYDPATDTWSKARNMIHERSNPAISVVDGKIYVMGGGGWPPIPNRPGPLLSSIEMFNPRTNQWRERMEMFAPKSGHTASVINGKVYVMGGSLIVNETDVGLSTIEIYHPEIDRWTQEPEMPVAKFGHNAEVIKRKIYIINGSGHDDEPLPTVEVYEPEEFRQRIDPTGKLLKTWGTIKDTP